MNNKIDLFARRAHYIDHLAPVWRALPTDRRGVFYTNEENLVYALSKVESTHVVATRDIPDGDNPILVCAYGDMNRASRSNRLIINMEHGTGHTFGTPAYPNGQGKRDAISLFLAPNQYTAQKIRAVRDSATVWTIGTPKVDDLKKASESNPNDGTVCISFHWGNNRTNPPEAGSALEHYRAVIPILKRNYKLIAHGHPLAEAEHRVMYDHWGIEYVSTFEEVCRRASVYVNDISSTLYEFTAIGRQVVLLNAPWFRRGVHHGIRFWDYSNIGFHVDNPVDIFYAIDQTLKRKNLFSYERAEAIRDLYPFLGISAEIAAAHIVDYLESL